MDLSPTELGQISGGEVIDHESALGMVCKVDLLTVYQPVAGGAETVGFSRQVSCHGPCARTVLG